MEAVKNQLQVLNLKMHSLQSRISSKVNRSIRSIQLRRSTICSPIEANIIFARSKINGVGYFLPYSSLKATDLRQLSILNKGFHLHLLRKYTHDEIALFDTDVVIDCGSFVGGFTIAAAQSGVKHIFSIEPSTKNFKCLQLNLCIHGVTNVTPLNIALGNNSGTALLNLSSSGCDDSILEPDSHSLGESQTVNVETLEDIINQYNIDPNSLYLKIEAEGFEPEILKGLGNNKPRVIAIDVTPERNGESPRSEIEEIIRSYGYTLIKHTTRCLFAIN